MTKISHNSHSFFGLRLEPKMVMKAAPLFYKKLKSMQKNWKINVMGAILLFIMYNFCILVINTFESHKENRYIWYEKKTTYYFNIFRKYKKCFFMFGICIFCKFDFSYDFFFIRTLLFRKIMKSTLRSQFLEFENFYYSVKHDFGK